MRYTAARKSARPVRASANLPVHQAADGHRQRLAAAIEAGLKRVRAKTSTHDIEMLIRGGVDPTDVIPWGVAVDVTPPAGVVLKAESLNTIEVSLYEEGWGVGAKVSGNLAMPAPKAAIEWAQEQSSRLISGVTDTTRQAISSVIANGLANGRPPMETAKILRASIGLTPQQAQSVANYRQGLVDLASGKGGPLAAKVESGGYAVADSRYGLGGLTDAKIDKMTSSFADRQLTARANTIAHTETMAAANAGVKANWLDAVSQGMLDPTTMGQQWIVTDDDKTCDECMDLEDEIVALDDSFSSGDDEPPLHPDCRCTIGIAELPADYESTDTTPPDMTATGPPDMTLPSAAESAADDVSADIDYSNIGDLQPSSILDGFSTQGDAVLDPMRDAGNAVLFDTPPGTEMEYRTIENLAPQYKDNIARDIAGRMSATSTDDLVHSAGTMDVVSGTQYAADAAKLYEAPDGEAYAVRQLADDGSPASQWGVHTFFDAKPPEGGGEWTPEKWIADQREHYAGRSSPWEIVVKGEEASDDLAREMAVSDLVGRWAVTSNDGDPIALAIQRSVQTVFSLDNTMEWNMPEGLISRVQQVEQMYASVYDDFVRSQYAATQELLASKGITEMDLARGFDFGRITSTPPDWLRKAAEVAQQQRFDEGGWTMEEIARDAIGSDQLEYANPQEIVLRPASSFSSQTGTASGFTGNTGAKVFVNVPASRILSTARSGNGCLGEYEFVVIGGNTTEATVMPIGDFESLLSATVVVP